MSEMCQRENRAEGMGICSQIEGNKVCGAYVLDKEVLLGTCLEETPETPVTEFPEREL